MQEKWRLKIGQGAKHSDYVHHLYQEYAPYVRAKVSLHEKRQFLSFSTLFHTDFNKLAHIFVNSQGKKHIGAFFSENPISPISLAYWFMDDGGLLSYNKDYPRRGVVLNTHGFTEDECKVLSENLNNTYNLHSWCKKNKARTIIAFSGKEWDQVWHIISPHILQSMCYKLPTVQFSKRELMT